MQREEEKGRKPPERVVSGKPQPDCELNSAKGNKGLIFCLNKILLCSDSMNPFCSNIRRKWIVKRFGKICVNLGRGSI